jgi:hypothetical protein
MLTDIFGGVVDEARQRKNGHYWVGLGTPEEHCMTCRLGPTEEPCLGHAICKCGRHLDEHQHDIGCGKFEYRARTIPG